MKQQRLAAIACLGALLMCGAARSASRAPQQNPPDTSAESTAYRKARDQNHAQTKIKLLDDFAATYPNSSLLPNAYRNEYMTYFSLGDYPETAAYIDKFLAFGDQSISADRLEALIGRAEAFLAGCVDAVFRTPQSYTAAKRPPRRDWRPWPNFPARPTVCGPGLAAQNGNVCSRSSNSAAAIAELGLKDANAESCKGPGSPAFFDRVIETIRQQERDSPNVR